MDNNFIWELDITCCQENSLKKDVIFVLFSLVWRSGWQVLQKLFSEQ